jgi:hypothetical protein
MASPTPEALKKPALPGLRCSRVVYMQLPFAIGVHQGPVRVDDYPPCRVVAVLVDGADGLRVGVSEHTSLRPSLGSESRVQQPPRMDVVCPGPEHHRFLRNKASVLKGVCFPSRFLGVSPWRGPYPAGAQAPATSRRCT